MILLPLSEDDRMDAEEHDITSFLHLQRLLDIQKHNDAVEKKSSKDLYQKFFYPVFLGSISVSVLVNFMFIETFPPCRLDKPNS